ncbi:hypothetical protein SDC9_162079 [bioreactor metagenome]|uniref:Uncharacterized protein n=1 Tax=bioreactor metagenome TaxID=1076179 RepID=A0A645FLD6_9ZZZZ
MLAGDDIAVVCQNDAASAACLYLLAVAVRAVGVVSVAEGEAVAACGVVGIDADDGGRCEFYDLRFAKCGSKTAG